MVQIIAISGKVNSGKNYFSYLCQTYSINGYPKIEEIAFADSLKEIVSDVICLLLGINISREKLDYLKNHGKGIYYMTKSTFMIFMIMLLVNIASILTIYNMRSSEKYLEYQNNYIEYVTIFGVIMAQFAYMYLTHIKFKMISILLFIITFMIVKTCRLEAFIIITSSVICIAAYYMITKKYMSTPTMRHILQITGTDIIRKHLGEQVFVIALLNKIVRSDADVITIPDCRMNEYEMLIYWAPIILKYKKYIIRQVYIERDEIKENNNRVMNPNEKKHYSETVELSRDCVHLKNDGTVMGFWHVGDNYWHDIIMPEIKKTE
jgi:hypothetical protein